MKIENASKRGIDEHAGICRASLARGFWASIIRPTATDELECLPAYAAAHINEVAANRSLSRFGNYPFPVVAAIPALAPTAAPGAFHPFGAIYGQMKYYEYTGKQFTRVPDRTGLRSSWGRTRNARFYCPGFVGSEAWTLSERCRYNESGWLVAESNIEPGTVNQPLGKGEARHSYVQVVNGSE